MMSTAFKLSLLSLLMVTSHGFEYQLSLLHGQVASANFSEGYYPNMIDEQLILEVRPGHVVSLYFDHFHIEEGNGDDDFVCGDYVELIDGNAEEGGETIAKMCGNSAERRPFAPTLLTQKFKSSGSQMTIKMKSDRENGGIPGQAKPTGFRAYYQLEDIDECEEQKNKIFTNVEDNTNCEHYCINFPGSYKCACDIGYYLSDDGRSCYAVSSACETFDSTSPSGVITPPMYKGKYARNITCSWKLMANPGENIHLTFDANFDVEPYNDNICFYDFVQVEDHKGVKGKFCGTSAPSKTLKSISDWMLVTFHSDHFVEGSGFTISYSSEGVKCRVPELPTYGRIVQTIKPSDDGYTYVNYGDSVKVKCFDGFWMKGNAKLNCLKDGSWSSKMPKCISI